MFIFKSSIIDHMTTISSFAKYNPQNYFVIDDVPSIETIEEEIVVYREKTYSDIANSSLQYLAKIVGFVSLEIIINRAIFYLSADRSGPCYNFSIQNSFLQKVGNFCSYMYPSKIESAICSFFPRITLNHEIGNGQIRGELLLSTIFSAAMEEVVFRKIIQQGALPAISKILPEKCGQILNDKIFRVITSSILFALAHTHYFQWNQGVVLPFKSGLLFGALVESEGNIALSTTVHFVANFLTSYQAIPASDWYKSIFSLSYVE